ncbi:MAG: tRNA epoxyqueuosine(34) reductase QueG [Pseudomonadota bacterium]
MIRKDASGSDPAANAAVHRYVPEGPPPDSVEQTPLGLTRALVALGRELGFARVGVARAEPLEVARARLEAFLAAGYAGSMEYLGRVPRHDPRSLLPEARSVVVVALPHGVRDLVPLRSADGRLLGSVARYARGADYHGVLRGLLAELAARLATLSGRPLLSRACVDTAPLLERELAARAGVGFPGKSGMVIAPGLGSYFLLGELVTDLDLEPSAAIRVGCGSCRACLDACPTRAFVGPYVLDARRCIAYLTIESSAPIPRELRSAIGQRVFGCDVCQEVCPYNASGREPPTPLAPRPELTTLDLVDLLELGSSGYRRLVRDSALRRASLRMLQRNAAVALGNSDDPRAVPPLERALAENPSALVRGHAAWALGALRRHATNTTQAVLERAASTDADPFVREEATRALGVLAG